MLIADFSRAIADGTPSRKHKGAIRPLQEATDSQSPSKKGKGKDKVGRMADDKEKADEESRKKRRVEETILVLDSDEEQYWQQVDSQIFEAYPEVHMSGWSTVCATSIAPPLIYLTPSAAHEGIGALSREEANGCSSHNCEGILRNCMSHLRSFASCRR